MPSAYFHPQFQAFSEGVNLELAEMHHLHDFCTDVAFLKRLVASQYNRQPKEVTDVTSRIDVLVDHDGGFHPRVVQLLLQLFRFHLLRWINGDGLPLGLVKKQVTSRKQYEESKGNAVYRAKQLLFMMTGHKFVPADPSIRLQWKLHFDLDFEPDYPLTVHVCHTHVDVHMIQGIRNLLLQSFNYDDATFDSAFDYWMSKEVFVRVDHFNFV
ncbi:hypothetical protein HMN09_00574400 [Mycena chlorophos]|uniref:Uncharacterized protein n=1 Tax=Mycena chlorophos TaxID=658473 RepID=A0A8H6TCB3_MYCCL|nr:hypothetical protein HMN09_00574400 [Mycena chlorophos]